MQAMAGTPCHPRPRKINEALLVLVLWLMKAKLYDERILLATLRRAQLFTMVFSGDKDIHYCYSRLHPYLLCGSSNQKLKLKDKVHVWFLCTGIATFWRLYCYHWPRNLWKKKPTKNDTLLKVPPPPDCPRQLCMVPPPVLGAGFRV
jgi:hypothetical protein